MQTKNFYKRIFFFITEYNFSILNYYWGILTMSSSFKIKVVAAGWEPAKKDFFQKCRRNINSFFNSCYMTVGVDIKTASYSNDFDDCLTMSIWDINSSERFRFIYPNFFKGAAACLLFYDISVPQSFKQLNYYMQYMRSDARYNPIFMLSYLMKGVKLFPNTEEDNRLSPYLLIKNAKKELSLEQWNIFSRRIMLIHCKNDRVIKFKNFKENKMILESPEKNVLILKKGGHSQKKNESVLVGATLKFLNS